MRARLLALLLGIVLGFAVLEVGLRIASVTARAVWSRATDAAAGGRVRLVCVGDSNTYGVGVHPTESYPWRLERLLNEAWGADHFEVVNLGVPGLGSAQLRHRLPRWLSLYQPDAVVVLIGANDFWNRAEVDVPAMGFGERLHELAMRLRVYRFAVLWLHARNGGVRPVVTSLPPQTSENNAMNDWTMRDAGGSVVFRLPRRADPLGAAAHARLLHQELEAIVRELRQADVPAMLATYAADEGPYGVANGVIRAVATAEHVPLADAKDLWRFMLPDAASSRPFYDDLHPRAPVYAAFAANVRDALLRVGMVAGPPSPAGAGPAGP